MPHVRECNRHWPHTVRVTPCEGCRRIQVSTCARDWHLTPPFPPRRYQLRAFAALRQAYREGKRRILLVSPTGSGKTFMCSMVVASFIERAPDAAIAWMAHRRELVKQGAASLERWGLDVGYSGQGSQRSVQVVSVGGALARGEVPPAKLCVLDEAHHFAADEWGALPKAYGDDVMLLGATATPERGDGRPLDHLFDHMIVVAQPRELVETGDLVPCITYRPKRPQRKGKVAHLPVDAYLEYGFIGKKAVVFASNVEEATVFAEQFNARGIVASVIHGKTPTKERDKTLAAFAAGSIRVLVNVFVLTEGWDCPDVEVVMLARRCGSQSMLMQAVGRGMRPAEGKEACHFADLCGVTHLLGDPVDDREYSLEGQGITCAAVNAGPLCRICGSPPDLCECGAGGGTAQGVATASGDALERFARVRLDDEAQRISRLAKWIGEAEAKKHKWQAALYRYRGAYGGSPTAVIVSKAKAIAHGKTWCAACKHSNCRCDKNPVAQEEPPV